MQKLIDIKQRIETVEGIEAIARSLATVSSAKLSRTREKAAGARIYVGTMRDMLESQLAYATALGIGLEQVSPLLCAHEQPQRVMFIHMSGDRGMCGNYNVSVNRATIADVERLLAENREVSLVLRGRHGERALRKRLDVPVIEANGWPRAGVTDEVVDALFHLAVDSYLEGRTDEVWCRYTRYISAVRRVPSLVRLLPIEVRQPKLVVSARSQRENAALALTIPPLGPEVRWWHEPSLSDVLVSLTSLFSRAQFEDVLLESYASEHAARMVTMQEASERADRTLQDLRVKYNRLRREAITSDLLGVLFASRLRGETVAGARPQQGRFS